MTHILHDCPVQKLDETNYDWWQYFKDKKNQESDSTTIGTKIPINLDAHRELTNEIDPDTKKPRDSGERHCPYCGADIKKEPALNLEFQEVLGAIPDTPQKRIPIHPQHEKLQYKVKKSQGVKA